jgi:predicted negative regulator of RcsB-dependent stress response
LKFGWKYYNEDDHGSVPLISEYDALRFMFSYYRLPEDPEPTIDKFTDHFKMVSAKLGYTMLPPEDRINQTGYNFLGEKKYDKAFTFFDYNIKTYPRSQNVFDSMGDYYLAVSDTTKAIESFKKALAIGEVEATRNKLNELEKKK